MQLRLSTRKYARSTAKKQAVLKTNAGAEYDAAFAVLAEYAGTVDIASMRQVFDTPTEALKDESLRDDMRDTLDGDLTDTELLKAFEWWTEVLRARGTLRQYIAQVGDQWLADATRE